MLKRLEWIQFIQEVEKCQYIICVGAGRRLQRMLATFNGTSLIEKIKYIADNDVNKQGKEVWLGDKNLVIQSVAELVSVCKPNVIVVITCLAYADLLDQLVQYDEFKRCDIYDLTHILAYYCDDVAIKKTIPDNLKLSDKMIIPKVIHYCWFGKNPIPDKYRQWMESWKRFCPDYEIVEWNENNYDISKNPYMLQAYEQQKWGFVPDYARLDIIYTYGGIYLDTDVEIIRNMDDLLYQRGFAGFESEQHVALGLGFGAVAGNHIIKGMRDTYDNYTFLDQAGNPNLTASPIIQTQFLLEHGLKQDGEYQVLEDEFTIYPEKMLCGKSLTSRRIKLTPYTRAIHHYDGSWLDDEKRNIIRQLEKEMNGN